MHLTWRVGMLGLVMAGTGAAFGAGPLEFQEHIIKMVETLKPGVVSIQVEVNERKLPPQMRQQPRPGPGPRMGGGSGFVIDPKGFVITNFHVIQYAKKIRLAFSDKHRAPAEVVGYHKRMDLALLKFDPKGAAPKVVTLADSDALRVGEFVVAIGSPLGYAHTVTFGMVSALDRLMMGADKRQPDLIQTDCPINPGNSGGPLINMKGEVVGVNSMIAGGRGNIGLGFAIPANTVKRLLPKLMAGDKNDSGIPFVGIRPEPFEDEEENASGVRIAGLTEDSPAEASDLRKGDVIQQVDGRPIKDFEEFATTIARREVGDVLELTVLPRGGGALKSLKLTLAEMPEPEMAPPPAPRPRPLPPRRQPRRPPPPQEDDEDSED